LIGSIITQENGTDEDSSNENDLLHDCLLVLRVFLPAYHLHGRSALLVRNKAIIAAAQLVVAFWDGQSTGTAHALRLARQRGLVCHVFWPS